MNRKLRNPNVLAIFILFLQFGCSPNEKTNVVDYTVKPLIIFDNNDGWGGDVRISIIAMSENDTAKIYKAVSSYQNKNLGLLIFIPKEKEDSKGFGKSVTIKSLGKESDNLINELANLYKQKTSVNYKFVSAISPSYVNLNKFAKNATGQAGNDDGAIDYKLFFETKNDEAEIFLNINSKDRWIELKEKDQEYRPLLIKVLSRKDK